MMEEVRVNLGERSYSIYIGIGILNEVGRFFAEQGLKGKVMIVTNPTVAQWYLEPVRESLQVAGFVTNEILIPDGEIYKTLAQAEAIYTRLLELEYDRDSIIVALGGGVIGDLSGFVAATYQRGVKFVQLPTTLLAQVDSSVGGKVAVNHPLGKNMIGAFYQPQLVITDVNTLITLAKAEFSSGMAEVIKHGLALDENYYLLVKNELPLIRELEPRLMTWVVAGSCRIKACVVERDEKEAGLRAVLNLGHTIGHALENVTNYIGFKHGEAVALGMKGALLLAQEMEVFNQPEVLSEFEAICQELELPTTIDNLESTVLWKALQLDKKATQGKVRWVLPSHVGETQIRSDVPEATVIKVLKALGGI